MYVVTGATGNVGSAVVEALAGRGEQVRAVSRHPPDTPSAPTVEPVAGDLNDPATLAEPLEGATGAFLLSGYADMPRLLELARGAGVRRVVLLSSSSVATGRTTTPSSRTTPRRNRMCARAASRGRSCGPACS